MLRKIIAGSAENPFLVGLLTLSLIAWGGYAMFHMPVDAIPDLSDVQVIVFTEYPGQAPQVVEDRVTYPLSTAMLSVPRSKVVRGYSFFGLSFVYIIFEDGTDPYWARSRVLENLNFVSARLPDGITPSLGPDATGVGWIYEYALVDRTGQHDLAQLRSIQDWYLRYELQAVPGVSEVASVGGHVRQYQVEVDPNALLAYNIPLAKVKRAIQRSNNDVGGKLVEMAETEYMVRGKGYIKSIADLEVIPVGVDANGTPIRLMDVATVQLGPELRRGLAELDGEGEVVGGVVIMRFGENALTTIERVREKLEELKAGLPEGVEIIPVYERGDLIERAVDNLAEKLIEESIVVSLICVLFLLHARSAMVAVVTLPIGILMAFVVMQWQGINANIVSLGGIAIAIGAMVDAAIVMIENVHKHIERLGADENNHQARVTAVYIAAKEVGSPLFFSLLIIAFSFVPIFSLEAQEARLFLPLAFTKTYAMVIAAGVSITLVPALMVYLIKGNIRREKDNALSQFFIRLYTPVIKLALQRPMMVLALTAVLLASTIWPFTQMGSEFMPEMDEGDLLYMPTTLPGISIGKAREILQRTDKLIKTVPEVARVFGKVGRAETATDPAPLTMIETTIQLKPRDQWRDGMTMEKIKQELDVRVQIPSLNNAWLMPIRTRINMQSTGISTPIGLKISGPDLNEIQKIGQDGEGILRKLP